MSDSRQTGGHDNIF